jgi:DNA-directed RNA polymerase specialized sigma24 family protein
MARKQHVPFSTGKLKTPADRFVERDVAAVYDFVVRELSYHDALNDLGANELDPYDIIDEAFLQLVEQGAGDGTGGLPPRRRLEHAVLEVLHRKVAELEERERRESSLEGNYRDPAEEDGFRTLGEHVLDFWQPDQDLSQQDVIPDLETPTPAEVEDMRERQHEIYAALSALPRRWREDFVLFAVEHWTLEELASRHGVDLEIVRRQLHATQSYLLERLRERQLLEGRPPRQQPHTHDRG